MNKSTPVKFFAVLLTFQLLLAPSSFAESPWVKNDSVFEKMTGKLGYGLKNSLLGWTSMFIEAAQPQYKTEWNGFCVGVARGIFYTGSGLIQLATFPIPVDFPDLGPGIHIPQPRDNYSQTIGVNKGVPNSAPVTKPSSEEIPAVKAAEPVSAPPAPASIPAEKKIEAVVYEVPPPAKPEPMENKIPAVPSQPEPETIKEEAPAVPAPIASAPTQKLDQLESDLDKLLQDEIKSEAKKTEPVQKTTPSNVKIEDLFPDGKPPASKASAPAEESETAEESSLEDSLFAEDDELFKEMDAELEKTLQKSTPAPKKTEEISDYTAR